LQGALTYVLGYTGSRIADNMATDNNKAVVAGAGPVGALAAIALARQGWDVEVKDLHCRVRLFDSL